MWLFGLVAGLLLGSCQSSDDDTLELTDNCYLISVSLGQLKLATHITGSQGQDSVYYASYAGSLYPMTIDQRRRTVENADSLPYGTRVDAVQLNVTCDGVAVWRPASPQTAADSLYHAYSASDSLDLRHPVELIIVANNGLSQRSYTLRVNVHKQEGDSMTWARPLTAAPLEAMTARRAFTLGGRLTVVGQTDGGVMCATLADTLWTATPTGLPTADIAHIAQRGDTLYMTSEGSLLRSTDGLTWDVCGQAPDIQLAAASAQRLYGLQRGTTLVSTADLASWSAEQLDDATAPLPTEQLTALAYTEDDGQQRLLLTGYDHATPTTWLKTWGTTTPEASTPWVYYTPNAADLYRLPHLTALAITRYDDGLVALGQGQRTLLYSPDHGITWRAHSSAKLCPALQDDLQTAQRLALTHDAEGHLYVLTDNNLWRGRLNRLGFSRDDR